MNLLLLQPADLLAADRARITDERALHIAHILKLNTGDSLRAGLINGQLGQAVITACQIEKRQASFELQLQLDQAPPAPLPVRLFLALPRPNMLGRLLRDVTSTGVKDIHLFQSAKVEKSFWQTPVLQEESIARLLHEGLTQARDTIMPTIHRHARFSEALQTAQDCGAPMVLADPFSPQTKAPAAEQCSLFIGPEGGFTEDERQQILAAGAHPLWLGSRILRVEPAVLIAIGHLSAQRALP